jgi:hypothetical protein
MSILVSSETIYIGSRSCGIITKYLVGTDTKYF